MKIFLSLLITVLVVKGYSQNYFFVVKIKTIDEISGMVVKNTKIKIENYQKELLSDKNGEIKLAYTLDEPIAISSFHTDYYSYIGKFTIKSDTSITISLRPYEESILLEEIEAIAQRDRKNTLERIGSNYFSSIEVKSIPSIGGEKDLIKAIQLLPGFTSGTEGTTELSVRGGQVGQNHFLIDGYTLYKHSHLYGLMSSYNNLTINETDIYKSSFPAQYGGRVSSIIDAKTETPSTNKFKLIADIGLLSAKTAIHLPVIKNKASLLISGRTSFIDKLAKPFQSKENYQTVSYHDLYAKFHLKPNQKSEFNIDFFRDYDQLNQLQDKSQSKTENLIAAKNKLLGIRYVINPNEKSKLFFQLGITGYTNRLYYLNENTLLKDYLHTNYESNLTDRFITSTFDINFNEQIKWKFGGGYTQHISSPSTLIIRDGDVATEYTDSLKINLNEFNIFQELTTSLYNTIFIDFGLRLSIYGNYQPFFEPRLNFKYRFSSNSTIGVSYTKASQAMHLLTNPGLGLSNDIWLLSQAGIPPAKGQHFSVSWSHNLLFFGHTLQFDFDSYFKIINGDIAYRDGFNSNNIYYDAIINREGYTTSSIVTFGKTTGYGIELMLSKTSGQTKGCISYTWANSTSQFKLLNSGNPFPSQYDRRHALSINISHSLNERSKIVTNWNFGSALPISLAQYFYILPSPKLNEGKLEGAHQYFPVQKNRNSFRGPASHVLNISYMRNFKMWGLPASIEAGVYNVYNQKNPIYYTYSQTNVTNVADKQSSIQVSAVSVLPIMPYFSLNISIR